MNCVRGLVRPVNALFLLVALAAAGPAQSAGLQSHVVFTQTTPLASAHEILRRTVTPLRAAGIDGLLGLPLDVSKESFTLYVPARKPPGGYGLMVFVPPSNGSRMASGWAKVMDEKGMIFVRANQSGNDAKVRSRRIPLALIAAENVLQTYPVNPSRVIVAGFSGGSRVALFLALAYPDVFRGALLNSGSDPIGTADVPLPPRPLFHLFQTRSRIVYVVGKLDQVPYNRAWGSIRSLRDHCVSHATMITMWHAAHAPADPTTLSRALDDILGTGANMADDQAACRAHLDRDVADRLQRVKDLIAAGDRSGAGQMLNELDTRYGGLAAPESVTLGARLH